MLTFCNYLVIRLSIAFRVQCCIVVHMIQINFFSFIIDYWTIIRHLTEKKNFWTKDYEMTLFFLLDLCKNQNSIKTEGYDKFFFFFISRLKFNFLSF